MSFFKFITEKGDGDKRENKKQKTPKLSEDKNFGKTEIENFSPRSFDDVAQIIDLLKSGKPAIVRLSAVGEKTAQRVIDLLSGAAYALNGNVCELEKDVYLFTSSKK